MTRRAPPPARSRSPAVASRQRQSPFPASDRRAFRRAGAGSGRGRPPGFRGFDAPTSRGRRGCDEPGSLSSNAAAVRVRLRISPFSKSPATPNCNSSGSEPPITAGEGPINSTSRDGRVVGGATTDSSSVATTSGVGWTRNAPATSRRYKISFVLCALGLIVRRASRTRISGGSVTGSHVRAIFLRRLNTAVPFN